MKQAEENYRLHRISKQYMYKLLREKCTHTEKKLCDTCQGKGEVFQESGAGIHATANMGFVECPDCEGTGEIVINE
jgi:DnaJ-class molecular chaperone